MTSRLNHYVLLAVLALVVVLGVAVSSNANMPAGDYGYQHGSSVSASVDFPHNSMAYHYTNRIYR